MRYFAAHLIFLAVLLRAVGGIQDGPPVPTAIWALLAVFGVVLFIEPPLTRRWTGFPRLYALVQSGMVIAMLYTAPTFDFLSMLFFPLSFQVVQFFQPRIGFIWIGVYSLAMAGMLIKGLEWRPGIVMLLLNSGVNMLMGSYAVLIDRTERARQENQRLFGELQSAYRGLKDYAAQAEALAAAEERHRMVRELHDSLTQTLFSMNLAAQAAQLVAGQVPSQVEGHLHRLQSLARSAAGEVQTLTGQAAASAPVGEGLAGALYRLVAERQVQDGLQIDLEVTGEPCEEPLPEAVTSNLYHIAQEALNNVARHARTRRATVRLNLAHPACLEVEDAGCGFDLQDLDRLGGFGLGGMAERAREIVWHLEILSYPGNGTRIRVREKKG